MTLLDFIAQSLKQAAGYNSHDSVRPRAILWTDPERLWEPVMDQVRARLPQVWTLGAYQPERRTGPSAYLRFAMETQCPAGETPVLHLPGIARADFRSAASMKGDAIHLFALHYEGQFWTQKNSRDWTPMALLSSAEGGLALDVAQDQDTRNALVECLAHLMKAEVTELQNRRVEAADIRHLVAGDPIRMLLQWLGDPDGRRKGWQGAEWTTFRAVCRHQFDFNPEKDGAITAAERLARAEGPWASVWQRFKEAPTRFPGVKAQLERARPDDLFGALHEGYPKVNLQEEEKLRKELASLAGIEEGAARKRIGELSQRHVARADWVWADLGEAPLARGLRHLVALLANLEGTGLPHTWEQLAQMYHERGWLVDSSALRALAETHEDKDYQAISAALRAVYLPWLDRCARHVQSRSAEYPNPGLSATRSLESEPGTVFLFVDGLRYDVARRLAVAIENLGFTVSEAQEWAALPSVTATSKPAWRPLADRLRAADKQDGFHAAEKDSGKELVAPRFRDQLESLGLFLPAGGEMADTSKCAWVEVGQFDRMGHDEGAKLAWRVDEQIAAVTSKVKELLLAGWLKVRLITDHGWLLLPGGLPKVDFPRHLTVSRWGRCALPDPGAQHGFPSVPWFWDATQAIVLAPGIGCFLGGMEYSHGGLSLQETLLPAMTVTRAGPTSGLDSGPKLLSLRWKNLRLVAQIEGATGLRADLRKQAADADASWLTPKSRLQPVATDGSVSVLVEDDALLGQGGQFVLVNPQGEVVLKRTVVVGEN